MMFKSAFIALLLFSSLLRAESGYESISPAQPTQNPEKIEVIEFFWYGCPHCYSLEPHIEEWLKTKPDNVEFIRQPAVFSKVWGDHAKAYLAAEALGVLDKVHHDLFDAIQNKKQKLRKEDDLAQFFAARGVDEKEFRKVYNSFLVDAKLRQAQAMGPRYGITGVPAIIINGKYKTNGPLAKSNENIIKIMNTLIAKESKK